MRQSITGQKILVFNICKLLSTVFRVFHVPVWCLSTFSSLLFALGKWRLWAWTHGSFALWLCLFCPMGKPGRRSEGRKIVASAHESSFPFHLAAADSCCFALWKSGLLPSVLDDSTLNLLLTPGVGPPRCCSQSRRASLPPFLTSVPHLCKYLTFPWCALCVICLQPGP